MASNEVTLTFAGDSDQLEKAFERVGASAKEMGDDVGSASKRVGSTSRDAADGFDKVGEAADTVDTRAMGFRDTLTGVADSMHGYNIVFGDARQRTSDLEAQIKALEEGSTDAEKQTDAYKNKMASLKDELSAAEQASGSLLEGWLFLGAGAGDLGSGIFNFVIPSLKAMRVSNIRNMAATARSTAVMAAQKTAMVASAAATRVMTIAQRGLNLAMRMNPIGLIITALTLLVVGLVYAYRKSETFRNIVNGAFRGVQKVVSWVVNWIKSNWRTLFAILTGPIGLAVRVIFRHKESILGFFRAIPGAIRGFFSGVAGILTWPFRQAVAGMRAIWNSTIGGKGLSVPGWVPGIGGNSFTIPYLHTGGVVPGAPGQDVLTMLQAGERVTRANASGPGVVIEIKSGGSALDDVLVDVLRKSIRVKGGNVQAVLGS